MGDPPTVAQEQDVGAQLAGLLEQNKSLRSERASLQSENERLRAMSVELESELTQLRGQLAREVHEDQVRTAAEQFGADTKRVLTEDLERVQEQLLGALAPFDEIQETANELDWLIGGIAEARGADADSRQLVAEFQDSVRGLEHRLSEARRRRDEHGILITRRLRLVPTLSVATDFSEMLAVVDRAETWITSVGPESAQSADALEALRWTVHTQLQGVDRAGLAKVRASELARRLVDAERQSLKRRVESAEFRTTFSAFITPGSYSPRNTVEGARNAFIPPRGVSVADLNNWEVLSDVERFQAFTRGVRNKIGLMFDLNDRPCLREPAPRSAAGWQRWETRMAEFKELLPVLLELGLLEP